VDLARRWTTLAPSRRAAIWVAPVPRDAPVWPDAPGPKVFGYLRNMPALEALLVRSACVGALLLVRDLPEPLRQRYSGARMRLSTGAIRN